MGSLLQQHPPHLHIHLNLMTVEDVVEIGVDVGQFFQILGDEFEIVLNGGNE